MQRYKFLKIRKMTVGLAVATLLGTSLIGFTEIFAQNTLDSETTTETYQDKDMSEVTSESLVESLKTPEKEFLKPEPADFIAGQKNPEATEESKTETETKDEEEVKSVKVDLKATGAVQVGTWEEFAAALSDVSVHTISLSKDIILSGDLQNVNDIFDRSTVNVDSGMAYMFVNKAQISRKLVIDATNPDDAENPFTFDFGTLAIGFNNNTLLSGSDWDITLQNIDIKTNVNYHGPFFFPRIGVGQGTSGMTLRLANQNLTYGQNYLHTRYINNFKDMYYAMATISVNKMEFTTDIVAQNDPGQNSIALNEALVANIQNSGEYASGQTSRNADWPTGQWIYMNNLGAARELYIEGNGYIWDNGGLVFCYLDRTMLYRTGSKGWDITLANMESFHINYYGNLEYHDLSAANQGDSLLTYKNFSNRGTQLTESRYSFVEFEGVVDIAQVESYTPVGSDGTVYATRKPYDLTQQGLAIANTIFKENSKVTITSLAGTGLQLRSTGSMVLEKGADVTVTREGLGAYAAAESASSAIDITNGSLTVKAGATLNAISNSTAQGSALNLQNSDSHLVVEKGGVVNLETKNYQNAATGAGGRSYSLLNISGGLVQVNGELNGKAMNQGNSAVNLIHGTGTLDFVIGREGTLDLQTDSTNTWQALIYMGSTASKFRFSDAKLVNLQRTKPVTGTNGLIWGYNGSILNVSVQNVYQWYAGNTNGGVSAEDKGFDKAYEPMSNMNIRYSAFGISAAAGSKTGNSMTKEVTDDFMANFKTEGQQRVLFEYVPNPSVEIQSISQDNPDNTGSVTVSGYARPNTFVRIWEENKNGTESALIHNGAEDTIPSPIDDPGFNIGVEIEPGVPMYTDNPKLYG